MQCNGRPVTVVVVNHNGRHYLRGCLSSLEGLTYRPFQVLVVDNASTDGSAELVRSEFPEVQLVRSNVNLGYCGGNNLGMRCAGTGLVALLNNDTVVDPEWLSRLVSGLASNPRACLVSGKVLLHADPGRVHYAGSSAHFLGQISNTHYLEPDPGGGEPVEVGVHVGSNVLVALDRLGEAAFLDDDFFIYLDELDLALRVRAMGHTIVYVPEAIVYHKAGTPGLAVRSGDSYPKIRAYLVSRNRLIAIMKNYSSRTIVSLLPVLALYEFLWATILARMGYWREYRRGWRWIHGHWPALRAKRRRVQRVRVMRDGRLLEAGPLTPVPAVLGGKAGRFLRKVANLKLRVYWAAVRWAC